MTNPSWPNNTVELGGVLAQDTISFGGVITSKNTPFSMLIFEIICFQ
jgi:hypothetical protein